MDGPYFSKWLAGLVLGLPSILVLLWLRKRARNDQQSARGQLGT
ncbi:hypothetical protein [Pedococcus sp. 5OH_020]|nr:hypothetical protein [Pedococcus sp. 5OH_020]